MRRRYSGYSDVLGPVLPNSPSLVRNMRRIFAKFDKGVKFGYLARPWSSSYLFFPSLPRSAPSSFCPICLITTSFVSVVVLAGTPLLPLRPSLSGPLSFPAVPLFYTNSRTQPLQPPGQTRARPHAREVLRGEDLENITRDRGHNLRPAAQKSDLGAKAHERKVQAIRTGRATG